ncbi:hypothetical protein E2C01_018144 [Portunus trituberculatus]|uniref:Uncharacterized protein n=1 Tax=Portunus trituberculatus TaxID=210409 RepID=A0A5B7DVM4_PORTR|nr:hypothetical protein [Portunus trituberculatus]
MSPPSLCSSPEAPQQWPNICGGFPSFLTLAPPSDVPPTQPVQRPINKKLYVASSLTPPSIFPRRRDTKGKGVWE